MPRPTLSILQILAWADAHRERTGKWPTSRSGSIPGTDETWAMVFMACHRGKRGMEKGDSLQKLLVAHRGLVDRSLNPQFTKVQILAWADEHRERTGQWPMKTSGLIPGTNGVLWSRIHTALKNGQCGRSTTLPKLLKKERGVDKHFRFDPLTIAQILAWADDHHQRSGKWPTNLTGQVLAAPGETWGRINYALTKGLRTLPGGETLFELLVRERGVQRSAAFVPNLSPRSLDRS